MKDRSILILAELKKVKSFDLVFKLVILFFFLIIGTKLICSTLLIYKIVGTAILGLMFAHAAELQHEVLHMSGGKTSIKRILGIVLGFPMLISFSHYQYNHMLHHRYLGTEKNTEFFDYGKFHTITSFIINLFMFTHYSSVAKNFVKSLLGKSLGIEVPRMERRVRQEYILLALLVCVVVVVSVELKTLFFIKAWLIPLYLIALPIHVLIELPEHFNCAQANQDVFENTRTIVSSPWITWFVNGNNFHVEHHYMPTVPINNLKKLHKKISHQIKHNEITYFQFYKKFFKNLYLIKKQRVVTRGEKSNAC